MARLSQTQAAQRLGISVRQFRREVREHLTEYWGGGCLRFASEELDAWDARNAIPPIASDNARDDRSKSCSLSTTDETSTSDLARTIEARLKQRRSRSTLQQSPARLSQSESTRQGVRQSSKAKPHLRSVRCG